MMMYKFAYVKFINCITGDQYEGIIVFTLEEDAAYRKTLTFTAQSLVFYTPIKTLYFAQKKLELQRRHA